MRITYVITRAEMGGAQVHVLDLLKGFAGQYTPSLITGERGYLTEECQRLGIETRLVPDLVQPLKPWQDCKALAGVATALRQLRPDLVHCHTSKAGIIGRLAARVWSIPTVFTAHTWSFADGTSKLWKTVGKPAERFSALWSQKIIAVSESNRKLAIDLGIAPARKIVTVYNGIEDTAWQCAPHQPGNGAAPEIVMVARFANQKNHAELVEALAGVHVPYRLSLVGDGPTRPAIEASVKALGMDRNVQFLGLRKDIDQILSRASIFALATKWEGFPLTILEAMRAGLPVIATNVDGVTESVRDRENGFVYEKGRVDQLRKALTTLLTDSGLRLSMGMAGRKRYETHFTREVMLSRTEGVYREVLAPRGHASGVLVDGRPAVSMGRKAFTSDLTGVGRMLPVGGY